MNHIIFDFDGVLVDSHDFHIGKINQLFDVGITGQEYKDMHNGNFYDARLEKMKKFDGDRYPDLVTNDQRKLPLISGAREVLEILSKDYHLHIISSGWEKQIVPFLENHNARQFFTELLLADHGKSKSEKFKKLFTKQKTNPQKCLFITDTLGDIHEACAVDVKTVAVTFGFHDKECLSKGNPAYIVNSWPEIQAVVKDYFE